MVLSRDSRDGSHLGRRPEARGMGTRDVGAVDGRRARVCESGGVRTRRKRVVVVVVTRGVRVEDVVASGVRV